MPYDSFMSGEVVIIKVTAAAIKNICRIKSQDITLPAAECVRREPKSSLKYAAATALQGKCFFLLCFVILNPEFVKFRSCVHFRSIILGN